MKEVPTKEESPFESWTKLIEKTMSGYPLTQAITSATQNGREDPWTTVINRLWEVNPLPIDPAELFTTFQQVWLDAFTNPTRLWTLYNEFVQNYTQLMTTETLRMWGLGQESKPLIEPEHGDKRFVAPDWQQNPVFDALKQSYLLAATTLLKTVSGIEGLDEKHRHQLTFFLRQYLDAISPTNFAFTNPQVIHETIASGGKNLVKGMQNLIRDINAGEIKITDTSAFEVGKKSGDHTWSSCLSERVDRIDPVYSGDRTGSRDPLALCPALGKQILHSGFATAKQLHQIHGRARLHRLCD